MKLDATNLTAAPEQQYVGTSRRNLYYGDTGRAPIGALRATIALRFLCLFVANGFGVWWLGFGCGSTALLHARRQKNQAEATDTIFSPAPESAATSASTINSASAFIRTTGSQPSCCRACA